jgi:hypothetical protein
MRPLLGSPEGLEKAFYGPFSRCPELCGGLPQEHGLRIAEGSDLRAPNRIEGLFS